MLGIEKLKNFRNAIYELFPKRKDAIFELIDSISSHAHLCNSVVELSEAEAFTREYTSITDAIADGLCDVNFKEVEKLVFNHCTDEVHKGQYHLFGTDVTAHPRLHAVKLKDRSIVHSPNYTPGQKPIVLGHQYSLSSWLPKKEDDKKKHWVVPIATDRVPSDDKPHEFGMSQLTGLIENLELTDELVVSVSDSAYGSENCRKEAEKLDNFVHIFRLQSNRNIFHKPIDPKYKQKKYGHKMSLGDSTTYCAHDEEKTTKYKSSKGKLFEVKVHRWNDLILRGSRDFKGHTHPLDLLKVEMREVKENGDLGIIIGKPMWLVAYGKRRREISTLDIYRDYAQRFDLEHFFRFGKNKLLLTKYQTPDDKHEEHFSKICLIAYAQLFLARNDAELLLKKWETYRSAVKTNTNEVEVKTLSPSQVQRTFPSVIDKVSTPAMAAKKRGISKGRKAGEKPGARENQPIIFKTKPHKQRAKIELSGFEKDSETSNIESLMDASQSLPKKLKKLGFTISEFVSVLEDTIPSG
jgi:hypothetical protein